RRKVPFGTDFDRYPLRRQVACVFEPDRFGTRQEQRSRSAGKPWMESQAERKRNRCEIDHYEPNHQSAAVERVLHRRPIAIWTRSVRFISESDAPIVVERDTPGREPSISVNRAGFACKIGRQRIKCVTEAKSAAGNSV